MNKYKHLILIFLMQFALQFLNAQETPKVYNQLQYRGIYTLSVPIYKSINLDISPQFSLNKIAHLEEYQIQSSLKFKPIKYITTSAHYYLIGEAKKIERNGYAHKHAFDIKLQKKIWRLKPSFRFRYSNHADDDVLNRTFFRYKTNIKYDIKNCKLTPSISNEVFQANQKGGIYKVRMTTGINYKISKKRAIKLSYKFDYFVKEYKNKHVLSLNYQVKL